MFKCEVCGASKAHEEFVDEIFRIGGKHVLVEHIPAMVCDRCGEQTFSRETTERMRKMLHGEAKPVRSLDLDVFAY
ncbi:MAG: type II toxin-antitoxin system MqsA family antitoxin [Candidatus Contendobacter sp.]